jgi:hypothetical protein
MILKPEQVKTLLPIITAYAEGKKIQCRFRSCEGEWFNADYIDFSQPQDFRIAPEPKLRPWRAEEVPVVVCDEVIKAEKYSDQFRRDPSHMRPPGPDE